MTKEEAIEAMKSGKNITHIYFTDNEYMTMTGNKIIFEDDASCWAHEFWATRNGIGWNDGYSIYKNKI